MDALTALIAAHEERLVRDALRRAAALVEAPGLARPASGPAGGFGAVGLADPESPEAVLRRLVPALAQGFALAPGEGAAPALARLLPDLDRGEEARRSWLLALLGYCRAAWLELVAEEAPERERMAWAARVLDYFDGLGLALARAWAEVAPPRVPEPAGEVAPPAAPAAAPAIEPGAPGPLSAVFGAAASPSATAACRALVESLNDPVFLLDARGRVRTMNHAAAALLAHREADPAPGTEGGEAEAGDAADGARQAALARLLPWLARPLERFAVSGERTERLLREMSDGAPACYQVHLARLSSGDDPAPEDARAPDGGIVVLLNDISPLRLAQENALREKERAEHYLAIAGTVILAMDTAGRVTRINHAGCALLGRDQGEVLGRDWFDLAVPVDQRGWLRALFDQAAAGRGGEFLDRVVENDVLAASGERRVIAWTNSAILDEAGRVTGTLSSGMDVTEQRRLSDVLVEYRGVMENFVDMVLVLDEGHVCRMANAACLRAFGRGRRNLVGLRAAEILGGLHDELRPLIVRALAGRTVQTALEWIAHDGALRHLQARVFPVRREAGEAPRAACILTDMTESKVLEQTLRRSEEKFRDIFETMQDGYILTDIAGGVLMANPGAATLLGYSLDELKTLNLSARVYVDPAQRDGLFERLRRDGRVRGFQAEFRRRDGSVMTADCNVRLVRNASGVPVAMENLFRDLTERKHLEDELTRLATTDSLTGVANRLHFLRGAGAALARARRYGGAVSVLMIDIDHFKRVNDTYGHQAGDEVLRVMAATAAATFRETDVFGRLGGEEFCALLIETGLAHALAVAERLRARIEALRVPFGEAEMRFTVSVGVTERRAEDAAIDDLVRRADAALYRAKGSGRNRVEAETGPVPGPGGVVPEAGSGPQAE